MRKLYIHINAPWLECNLILDKTKIIGSCPSLGGATAIHTEDPGYEKTIPTFWI